MTEFPIIPPDPDPDELAFQRRLAATFAELTDVAAVMDLAPEQRATLNDAARRMREADETWAELEDQVAGKAPRKPQRGRIPKRGARKRPAGPKATLEDVARLERELGL